LVDPDRPEAVMMWNPPHTLALYMPLALLPVRWAAFLWIVVQFVASMVACELLGRSYGIGDRPRLARLTGLVCVGTWWMVFYGQNTGLLALGLAGYLHFINRGKPLAAGAFAALTALKPHLLAGFGVLLLADAVSRRGRIVLSGGLSVIALSLGI